MTLSIIIVTYNVYNEIKNCIKSIYNLKTNIDFEIIVADNKSLNRDIDNIKLDFPSVSYTKLHSNLGFAKANNFGVKNSSSKYLCFLNPDTIIIEDFITPIIEFIEQNKNAGACAPMLLYEDRSYQSSTGFKMGIIYEFLEAAMLIKLIRRVKKNKYLSLTKSYLPVNVGWVSGACLVVKRSVFEQVGGFTEDYFLNYEDIDLCKKIEDSGYKNYYFPFIKCVHLDHKSFDKNYELLVFSRYESRLIYAKLHYNIFQKIITRIIQIYGLVLRLILVNVFYKGIEKFSRRSGYYKSLKLYLNI